LSFDVQILQSDAVCMAAQNQTEPDSIWQKTPYANLLRYNPSGKYFARIRVQGKLILDQIRMLERANAITHITQFHRHHELMLNIV